MPSEEFMRIADNKRLFFTLAMKNGDNLVPLDQITDSINGEERSTYINF